MKIKNISFGYFEVKNDECKLGTIFEYEDETLNCLIAVYDVSSKMILEVLPGIIISQEEKELLIQTEKCMYTFLKDNHISVQTRELLLTNLILTVCG